MNNDRSFSHANAVQKLLRRFAASGPGSWLFARALHRIDRPVHQLTRGRYTFSSLVAGLPVVMINTIGAKSGQPRVVPVLGIPVDGRLAVIASNFGQQRHPSWYYNLLAHPEVDVRIDGGGRERVRAVELEGDRRQRAWQEGLRMYPGFAQYERRASHRNIKVFELQPL
jgi:deazaflavin-dependent oxidoreductase (nitroreductase family)